jgi:hypothetical protein
MTTLSDNNIRVYDASGPKQSSYEKIVFHDIPYNPNAKFEIRHSGNDRGVIYGEVSSTLNQYQTEINNQMIRARRVVIVDPNSGQKKIRLIFASKAGVDLSSLTINNQKIDLNTAKDKEDDSAIKPKPPSGQDQFQASKQSVVSITDPRSKEEKLYSKIITIDTGKNLGDSLSICHSGKTSNFSYSLASNVSSSDDSSMKIKKEYYIDPQTGKKSIRLIIAVKKGVDLSDLKVNNQNINLGASKPRDNNTLPGVSPQRYNSTSASVEPLSYSPAVLTDEDKKYFSKKFILRIDGKKQFDISKQTKINGNVYDATQKFDAVPKLSCQWGGSVSLRTESQYNRVTNQYEDLFVIRLVKDAEPFSLNVNGVALDLNQEPNQTQDPYSHRTYKTSEGFEVSHNSLELKNSGSVRYPYQHSVVTNTSQDTISRSFLVSEEQYQNSLNSKESRYASLKLGSPYIATLADNIVEAKTSDTLYSVLKSTALDTKIPYSVPFYRLNLNESVAAEQSNKDFEVLIITGKGYEGIKNQENYSSEDDERRFLFDTKVLEHAIQNSKFKDECKEFHHVRNPNIAELERAISERARSAEENNRRLLIVYSGHGTVADSGNLQQGVDRNNSCKEGSKKFRFCTDQTFNEDQYKQLLNKYLSEVEAIHLINACHSGAALTMKAAPESSELLYA